MIALRSSYDCLLKEKGETIHLIGHLDFYQHVQPNRLFILDEKHFFSSKEQLFYEVMIHTHHQLYGDAIQYLFNKELPPEERLTKAIYQSVLTLHESGLWDFWQKDAKEILPKVRPQHLQSQTEREEKLFSAFLQSCPPLKVSKELAIKSLQSLIYSSSLYLFYKEDYEQILPMLVKGVCGSIFD